MKISKIVKISIIFKIYSETRKLLNYVDMMNIRHKIPNFMMKFRQNVLNFTHYALNWKKSTQKLAKVFFETGVPTPSAREGSNRTLSSWLFWWRAFKHSTSTLAGLRTSAGLSTHVEKVLRERWHVIFVKEYDVSGKPLQ